MSMPFGGLIAVDKLGNKIRFYDAGTLRQGDEIAAPEPCVHELAISHDRSTAFVPLYGDGIYGRNKRPTNKWRACRWPAPASRRATAAAARASPSRRMAGAS